jgi:zinc transport system ATP-binding protein
MRQASAGLPPVDLIAGTGLVVRRGARTVLDAVEIAVAPGEIVTLIGPNGAGKSTLVQVLLGLVKPDEGRVATRPGLRVGYSPQHLTLESALPLTVGRFLTLGARAAVPRLSALLGQVGLPADVLGRQMIGLSGGEQRRAVLVRALLRDPGLLMLDEPMSGVDVTGQMELYELIGRIRDRTGVGVLLVSHDLHLVMARTDRVVCLDGHVCCVGRPLEVAGDPAFQRLFGRRLGDVLTLYRHEHDRHHHHPSGRHHHAALETGGRER